MSNLYGRPTAAELIAAVADFLDNDVRGVTGPDGRLADGSDGRLADGSDGRLADAAQVNFHARVAANVLRIVERELLDGPAADVSAALEELGYADEAELAMAIRAGDLDDRGADVLAALRTIVRRRLDV
ncbi:MAG: DUF6285 domain-containing protein, partial [Mycobacterium sp.]